MLRKLSVWAVLFAQSAFAQLAVESQNAVQLSGISEAKTIGNAVFVASDATVAKLPVILITATTDAANITFEASDQSRLPVEFQQLTPNIIAVRSAGKTWVDVTAIDFAKNIYARKLLVVELGDAPDPPPDPPVPDNEIDNTYGVGKIAYEEAPADSCEKVAATYRQAADFLFGRPTAKTVEQCIDWLDAEITLVTNASTDWRAWQLEIGVAMMESQRQRQGFTRDDWYASFIEIAKALEARK